MGWTRMISRLFAVLVFAAGTGYADLPSLLAPDSPRPAARLLFSSSDEFESAVTASLRDSYRLSGRLSPPPILEGSALEEGTPNAELGSHRRDLAGGGPFRVGDPTRAPHVLADRHSELDLCLYALLSLGLYRSAPWLRRLSLHSIPDWYHSGGPSQIGHSFAISPDGLSAAPILCLTQPEPTAATPDLRPQHRWGIAVSLWRQSQFTPTALAARGPPYLS